MSARHMEEGSNKAKQIGEERFLFMNRKKSVIARALAVSLVAVLLLTGCAGGDTADNYPQKNIEIICPYSAGGGSDLASRSIAEGFNEIFEVTTIVTNKTGGNGQVGGAYVLGKSDDPYTILSANSGDIGGWMDAQVDYFDFQPIAIFAYDVNVLMVRDDSPFQTLQDLIDEAKANPKSVVFGGTIIGSTDQILCQMLIEQAGIDTEYVPFEGGNEVSSALLGGHITASWSNPAEAVAQIEAGKLRALAVSSELRLETLPDIPTTVECGYPDLTFAQFRGLMIGKDVDPAIVAKLTDAVLQVTQTEKFQQFAASKHWVINFKTPEEMREVIEEQDAIVRRILGKPAVEAYEW